MNRRSLYFESPRHVSIREETLPPLAPGQVLVKTLLSAISPGTEMLIYRGEAPTDLPADETISSLHGDLHFPLKYGYSTVGRVESLGEGVDPVWRDKLVFAFNPHETHFMADTSNLMMLPVDLTPEDGIFLPNMETAVNFLHDGAPLVGEQVIVFGQGIVGLLTTSLLARIPLSDLITLDRYASRRELSMQCGARHSLDPSEANHLANTRGHSLHSVTPYRGADLVYELTGNPEALDLAIHLAGFDGRVVIGSWYGTKHAALDLGGHFHRNRVRLISSQVSTISPALAGRWTKNRRFQVAWDMIRTIQPARLISHRIPFEDSAHAYQILDRHPDQAIQIILTYDH